MTSATPRQQGPDWFRTLVLLGVSSALGLAYIGYEYWYKPGQEDKEEAARRLFALEDAVIESMTLASGDKAFAFRCLDAADKMCKAGDQSNWEMTDPMKTSADKANVNSVLSSAKNLAAPDTVDLAEETPAKRQELLKGYGLDEPARAQGRTQRLSLKLAGGKTQTVHLGGTHPIGGKLFAVREVDGVVDDSKVFLVPSYFKGNLEKDLVYWRNKDLVKFSLHRIASFKFETPKIDAQIDKIEGGWDLKIREGGTRVSYTGDLENVDGLLTSVNYLKAKSFVTENKDDGEGRAVLAKARKLAAITIHPKAAEEQKKTSSAEPEYTKPFTVTLYSSGSGDGEKVYATVSHLDPLFELDRSSAKRFDKNLKDLRQARLITAMDRFSARRIGFAGKAFGEGVSVKRDDKDDWAFDKGGSGKLSEARINRVLDELSGNHIKEFLPASRIPAGEEDGVKVSLGDEGSPDKKQLVFWKKGETLYARDLKAPRKEAFEMAPSVAEGLPWTKEDLAKDPNKPAAPAEDDGHGHGEDDGHGH